ncbi:dihydroceramide fatty acyl 2-hydroxylase FAH1-like [Cucumis melo var. makuwa]|uniref:Dihydroceramide fatty acyl 2-hydroxylase FAH1-like n=1 Tax=Cucumis melo var. makuwa TaxID=1194695 RepID=A0A5D3CPJ0_CUCMM|nr:dihydroceramide fatty acyl 2-hydroxylase FAH1-like [Cucumis melo var. makuwa]
MVSQQFTVDLNKPLVFQVGHLGEAYQEWVHQPIISKERPRFFKSDFWEFCTCTAWWAVPLIWLPVVCWFVSMSVNMGHTFSQISLMVIFGISIWTLIEYIVHRFLFHIETQSYWGNTMHYLIHGCHHKHPMDSLRLVFPPTATAVLLVPLWNLVKLFFPPSMAPALFGGGLLGYVIYDVTHYYLHHGQPTGDMPKKLKGFSAVVGETLWLTYMPYQYAEHPISLLLWLKYHMNHHFRILNKGFGVTSPLWDRVFGTLPGSKVAQKTR